MPAKALLLQYIEDLISLKINHQKHPKLFSDSRAHLSRKTYLGVRDIFEFHPKEKGKRGADYLLFCSYLVDRMENCHKV